MTFMPVMSQSKLLSFTFVASLKWPVEELQLLRSGFHFLAQ